MTSRKKGVHFFSKGCCEKCTGVKAAEKKEIGKDSSKIEVPVIFVKGNYFGTPLYTMCWINEGTVEDRI